MAWCTGRAYHPPEPRRSVVICRCCRWSDHSKTLPGARRGQTRGETEDCRPFAWTLHSTRVRGAAKSCHSLCVRQDASALKKRDATLSSNRSEGEEIRIFESRTRWRKTILGGKFRLYTAAECFRTSPVTSHRMSCSQLIAPFSALFHKMQCIFKFYTLVTRTLCSQTLEPGRQSYKRKYTFQRAYSF